MAEEYATLKYDGKEIKLPIETGSEGERGINIATLRNETGMVTIDPGYVNTGSCRSNITFLNGEEGILRYRGYPIEQLAEHSSFIEVAYLLINGELPTNEQLHRYSTALTRHTLIHEDMKRLYDGFPRDAHPMATLSSAVSTLSSFYQDRLESDDPMDRELSMLRLMAKLPTIAAFAYKKSMGMPFIYPRNDLDYASNFLRMLFGVPAEDYEINPDVAKALDVLFILHADHEQNCSTSTVRIVGSSQANLYSAVSAGISALWGKLHGGANQAVIEMLEKIQANGGDASQFLSDVKDKKDGVRLMGFGHRVYKNFDPRAQVIKGYCDKVLNALGVSDPLLDIAKQLEETALKDDYFVERKLYPNVDFYSGIIYKAIGIPTNMFTVMFAIGRSPGWIAQWKEMVEKPTTRIGRPRQIYTGHNLRDYVSVTDRN